MYEIDDLSLLEIPKSKVFGVGDFGIRAMGDLKESAYMSLIPVQSKEIMDRDKILDNMRGGDAAFLVADWDGTNAIQTVSMLAECAREAGVLSVGWIRYVSHDKLLIEDSPLEKLKKSMGTVILMPGEFHATKELTATSIINLTKSFNSSEGIGLDWADFKNIFSRGGLAHISYGEATGEQALVDSVRQAADFSFAGKRLDSAEKILMMLFTADSSVEEANVAMSELQKWIHPNASVRMMSSQKKQASGIQTLLWATKFE